MLKKMIRKMVCEKPKKDFWMYAFLTLLLFQGVAPTILPYITMMQIGLVAPNVDLLENSKNLSIEMAEKFFILLNNMYEAGETIANTTPFIAKLMYYLLSLFIYSVYLAMIGLVFNLIKFIIIFIIEQYMRFDAYRKGK